MSDNSPKDVFTITPDWPRKGVRFFHMGPWLQNQAAFKADLLTIARRFSHLGITHIVYLGSRGFLLIPLSQLMNAKSVIIRKKGEMPPPVVEETYSGEYRDNTTIVISQGDIQKGARVLIVDDVLATGGTALASIKLVEKVGGQVVGLSFLLGLAHLNGEQVIKAYNPSLIVTCSYIAQADGSFAKGLVSDHFAIPGQRSVLDEPTFPGDDRAVVMWHKDSVEQARDLVQQYPRCFVGAPIKMSRFPDGHYDIAFNANLVGRHLVYVMSLLNPEETLHQLELLIALGRQHIKSFTVIINYFAPGTKERVDQPGELARAQTTAQLISKSLKAVPVMGPATVIIYDIHAVQEQFYFPDPCSLQLQSSTPLMGKVVADEKMVLVFPDQGAYKRFGKEAELKNVPTLICNKERGPNDSRVIVIADRKNCEGLTDAELRKRHLVIYDDIGHSGGTSWETFCMLKKQGFETISLYVTHAVFSLHAWMRFLPSGDRAGFHRIYTTNSVPSMTERYLKFYPETFTVLDLTKLTAEFICTKYDIRYTSIVRLSPPLEFEVWYGTTSKPKVEAIRNVFPNAKFLDGTDISTGVNPQPVGYVEIYTGVGNRMNNLTRAWRSLAAKRELTSHTVLVAIETGLVRTPSGALRDQTAVRVNMYDDQQRLVSSGSYGHHLTSFKSGPKVPVWVYDLVAASKFQKTAGQIICEKYPEQKLDDADWYTATIEGVDKPHTTSRVEYMVGFLKQAQIDIQADGM